MNEPAPGAFSTPPPLPARVVSPPMLPAVSGFHGIPAAPDGPFTLTDEDKTLGMLSHLLAIPAGFLGPLVMWLVNKDTKPFVAYHAKEALNFQITMLLFSITFVTVALALTFVLIGFLLFPLMFAIPIVSIILEIMAALAAQRGEWHRYPFCLRLVRADIF